MAPTILAGQPTNPKMGEKQFLCTNKFHCTFLHNPTQNISLQMSQKSLFIYLLMYIDVRQRIEATLKKRIMIFDGGMGTMIQNHHFEEADFRGESN